MTMTGNHPISHEAGPFLNSPRHLDPKLKTENGLSNQAQIKVPIFGRCHIGRPLTGAFRSVR